MAIVLTDVVIVSGHVICVDLSWRALKCRLLLSLAMFQPLELCAFHRCSRHIFLYLFVSPVAGLSTSILSIHIGTAASHYLEPGTVYLLIMDLGVKADAVDLCADKAMWSWYKLGMCPSSPHFLNSLDLSVSIWPNSKHLKLSLKDVFLFRDDK